MTGRMIPNSNPRYVIATVDGNFWRGVEIEDMLWTGDLQRAETYETLVEAHAKALWITFTYPRYLGFLEVVRADGPVEV